MQTINLCPPHRPGPLALGWASLFAAASNKEMPATLYGMPEGADEYIGLLRRGRPFEILGRRKAQEAPRQDPRNQCAVLFSGGKDSLAAALIEQEAGRRVVCVFFRGINRAYPGEARAARRLADAIGAEFVDLAVRLEGLSDHVENPTKNQVLTALAADWGMGRGILRYQAGIMARDSAAKSNYSCGFSDATEMQGAGGRAIAAATGGRLQIPAWGVRSDTHALRIILARNPALLSMTESCMTALRARGQRRDAISRRFGIQIAENRCGGCYKCALEYLHLREFAGDSSQERYARHCMRVLIEALPMVIGRPGDARDAIDCFFDPVWIEPSRMEALAA